MRQRIIGTAEVGPVGLGCMGLTYAYTTGMTSEQTRIEVVRTAAERGALIDTADVYGPYDCEELVGRALRGRRDSAVVATKVGLVLGRTERGPALLRDASPRHLTAAVKASLHRLGTEYLDLCQLHRVDEAVPLEESWGALAELAEAGLVRALGLSDVRPQQAAAAHAVRPVDSVQNELSVWNRDDEMVEWTARHGVALIAYAPLGRGLLARRFASPGDLAPDDMRRLLSRTSAEHLDANLAIVERVRALAERSGATAAQVALAWVLAQGEHVVAIPGTKRAEYLAENLRAASLALSEQDLRELAALPAASGAPL